MLIEFGSQSSDTPRTPTLRQWCKANPDNPIPGSVVKVIFNPGLYASYTFVTEHEFKVSVEKGSPLATYLENVLPQSLCEEVCLWIRIKDREKGSWALEGIEGTLTDWEEKVWGWKALGSRPAPTRPSTKATRPSTRSGSAPAGDEAES